MTNCKEFVLDDLMAITAIPVADFDPALQAWQTAKSIASSELAITGSALARAIVIGQQAATAGGTLIPIRRATGKAKDDEQDSVAGRLHTVTVSCQADDRDPTTWDDLLTLERTPSHLLLTFRDQTQGFAQATADTYLCTVERDGAKTSVSIKVQNWMGIQIIR